MEEARSKPKVYIAELKKIFPQFSFVFFGGGVLALLASADLIDRGKSCSVIYPAVVKQYYREIGFSSAYM